MLKKRSWWVVGIAVLLLVIQQLSWNIRLHKKPSAHDDSSLSPSMISTITSIRINLNSSYVRSDVKTMYHLPANSMIMINLQPPHRRRCQHPVLKGRISGPSLSMIQFQQVQDIHRGDVLIGTYDRFHMPVSGEYPVEIILLQCENYPSNRSLDLLSVCLEQESGDTTHITSRDEAFLKIDVGSKQFGEVINFERKGRWIHESLLPGDTKQNNNNTSNSFLPILTAFQPRKCRRRKDSDPACKPFTIDRRDRFQEYRYVWNSDREELNRPGHIGAIPETDKVKICFIGASHSGVLEKYCNALDQVAQSPNLDCQTIRRVFPDEVNNATALEVENLGCTHVVVGLFQHPFSFKHNKSKKRHQDKITFDIFKEDMTEVVNILTKTTSSKILLRSSHANGLGVRTNQCPPADARNPINAAISNHILQEITNEFYNNTVQFLDTSFLIDPVWDSASDWSHYAGEVATMEAKYILSEVLKQNVSTN